MTMTAPTQNQSGADARHDFLSYGWFARWHATRYPALDFVAAALIVFAGGALAAVRHDEQGVAGFGAAVIFAMPLLAYGVWNVRHRDLAQQVTDARWRWRDGMIRRHPVQAIALFPVLFGVVFGISGGRHSHHMSMTGHVVRGVVVWLVLTALVLYRLERMRHQSGDGVQRG